MESVPVPSPSSVGAMSVRRFWGPGQFAIYCIQGFLFLLDIFAFLHCPCMSSCQIFTQMVIFKKKYYRINLAQFRFCPLIIGVRGVKIKQLGKYLPVCSTFSVCLDHYKSVIKSAPSVNKMIILRCFFNILISRQKISNGCFTTEFFQFHCTLPTNI